jgi:hypothetical protein
MLSLVAAKVREKNQVLQTLISKADMLLLLLPGLYSCRWWPQSRQPDQNTDCNVDMLLLLLLQALWCRHWWC